ncbi:hypothetical protein VIGAN_11007800 [Vigna angularis var. angularis]|uniref:S-protein homolog n=1 Tax=Vigna angularis var. angularis TaxID=157739 RepID=A0A0S3T6W7_PHAAN|nr:hypothetical protein VIGAN_11007800 [Vigna angularis var. angularis]
MDSIWKMMRIVCWVLILGEHLKGGESSLQQRVTVKIVNKLHSSKIGYPELSVHCRDKFHNLGQVTLKYNEMFRFRFLPNVFASFTLYYCRFMWPGGNSYIFDIYVQERDYECNHYVCYWEITEDGPCGAIYAGSHTTACFRWKALPAKNYTLSS